MNDAEDKNFICLSCNWSAGENENKVYCEKIGYSCNGFQYRPVHFCDDYETRE